MSVYRQMGQLLEVLHKLKVSWKIKSNVEAKVVVLTSPRLKVIRLAWCPCANGLPHCKSSFFNTFVRIRPEKRILASPNGANAKVRLRQIAQGTHQVAKLRADFWPSTCTYCLLDSGNVGLRGHVMLYPPGSGGTK